MQANTEHSGRSGRSPYFNDFEELLNEKKAELERAAIRQAALGTLREDMLKIDCDHGVGNLEVGGELIKAVIDVANIAREPVQRVLNTYNWNRKFDVNYSEYHNTVVFEMEADFDRLCEDVEVN